MVYIQDDFDKITNSGLSAFVSDQTHGQFPINRNKKNMQYKFSKGLGKGIASVLLFGIPLILDAFIVDLPQYANLTLGGALVIIWNYLKVKYLSS